MITNNVYSLYKTTMSWKGYGGVHKLDVNNNITAYSFVADIFTLRKSYYGTFDICGELHVSGNARIDHDIQGNNVIVINDTSTNRLFVVNKTFHYNDVDISGNLIQHTGNVYLRENIDVSGHIYLRKELYLGNSFNAYLYGTDISGNIGINTHTPIATLDISSQYPFAFNVGSQKFSQIYSVPLQNNANKGFVLSANTSTSRIGFHNDVNVVPVTNVPDAYIQYSVGGFLTLDASQNINLYSNVSLSNRTPNINTHVMGEPVVIYDTSAGPYLYPVYANASETTGNALSLISNDAYSVTFMNMITPERQGISIGGGQYPNDPKKSYGSIGWRDGSANYTPSINVVSGNSHLKQKTTVGINTHAPSVENYAFEVNGPVHLKNGELTITQQADFEIKALATSRTAPKNAVAAGTYYKTDGSETTIKYRSKILYTTDGGENWYSNYDNSGSTFEDPSNNNAKSWRCAYVYDSSFTIMGGDLGYLIYTYNGYNGTQADNKEAWQSITSLRNGIFPDFLVNTPYLKIQSLYATSDKRVFCGLDISGSTTTTLFWFDMRINLTNNRLFWNGFDTHNISYGRIDFSGNQITSVDGIENYVWVTNGPTIRKYRKGVSYDYYETNPNGTNPLGQDPYLDPFAIPRTNTFHTLAGSGYFYNSISAFDSSNVIAGGQNIISWSRDSGLTWTDVSINNATVNRIYACDGSNAIAVCKNGIIFTSSDNYRTWTQISNDALNVSGNANRLNDPSYNLDCLTMVNTDNFLITKTVRYSSILQNGNTSLFHAYLPNLFNNTSNYVFDVSGSSRFSGDLNINDGGKIASNNREFNLLKNGVNTINFGCDASNVIIASLLNSTVVANYNLTVRNVIQSMYYEGLDQSSDILIGGIYNGTAQRTIKIGNFNSNPFQDNNLIRVGGKNDKVLLGGNILINNTLQIGPILNVNYTAGMTNIISTAAGTGFWFADSSVNNSGYFLVSNDLGGYVMQSVGLNNSNTIKLDVSNLIIPAYQTTALPCLSRTPTSGNDTDSNYTICVSSVDPSNIMIINKYKSGYVNGIANNQTVDTSFSVLGSMSIGINPADNKWALDVSGNMQVTGGNITVTTVNTIYYNNMSIGTKNNAIFGSILDVSGNVNIKGGNLTVTSTNTFYKNNVSIGTTTFANPGYILDVLGNVQFGGGYNTINTINTVFNNMVSIGTGVDASYGYILDVYGNVLVGGGNIVVSTTNTIYQNNVSIGTTNNAADGYILDVFGNVKIGGSKIIVYTSNTIYRNNVSIGTLTNAASNYILDVNGSVKMGGSIFEASFANTIVRNNITIGTGGTAADGNILDVSGNVNIKGGNLAVSGNLTSSGLTISNYGIRVYAGGIDASSAQIINFGINAPTMKGTNISDIPQSNITNLITDLSNIKTSLNNVSVNSVSGGFSVTSGGLNVIGTYLSTGYSGNFSGPVQASSYNATSDFRLKTNILPLSSQCDSIRKITPVTFDWISNGNPDIGFIAQNVYNTYPEIRPKYPNVDPSSNIDEPLDLSGNPIYYAIDYGRMTPFLWQGMREIIQRLDNLEKENAELKTRIAIIESK